MVESPTVKVLTGLTVPQFEQEMQHFVQAIGVGCGGCHVGRGNFASDENPRKVKARQMIEMTKATEQAVLPGSQAPPKVNRRWDGSPATPATRAT